MNNTISNNTIQSANFFISHPATSNSSTGTSTNNSSPYMWILYVSIVIIVIFSLVFRYQRYGFNRNRSRNSEDLMPAYANHSSPPNNVPRVSNATNHSINEYHYVHQPLLNFNGEHFVNSTTRPSSVHYEEQHEYGHHNEIDQHVHQPLTFSRSHSTNLDSVHEESDLPVYEEVHLEQRSFDQPRNH